MGSERLQQVYQADQIILWAMPSCGLSQKIETAVHVFHNQNLIESCFKNMPQYDKFPWLQEDSGHMLL